MLADTDWHHQCLFLHRFFQIAGFREGHYRVR
jgi:hypothetical protein